MSFDQVQNQVMLRVIDTRWMTHLQEMDYLQAGIGLRAFGQRDPLVEYKDEAYGAFQHARRRHVRGLPAHGPAHLQINVNLEQPVEQAEDPDARGCASPRPPMSMATSVLRYDAQGRWLCGSCTADPASASNGNAQPAPRTAQGRER